MLCGAAVARSRGRRPSWRDVRRQLKKNRRGGDQAQGYRGCLSSVCRSFDQSAARNRNFPAVYAGDTGAGLAGRM